MEMKRNKKILISMKKIKERMERFSFAQMTSNADGKTSASGTMGVLICVVGSFCFLLGCADKVFINHDIDIITQSIVFVGIGAGLLGLRKYTAPEVGVIEENAKSNPADISIPPPPPPPPAYPPNPDNQLNS
jgi:hypothetical protein